MAHFPKCISSGFLTKCIRLKKSIGVSMMLTLTQTPIVAESIDPLFFKTSHANQP